jgi:hypothetical protein
VVGNGILRMNRHFQRHDPKSVDLYFNPEDEGRMFLRNVLCPSIRLYSVLTGLAHAALTEDHNLERLLP